jgi:DNA-binding NarL/FixJ family response regulator
MEIGSSGEMALSSCASCKLIDGRLEIESSDEGTSVLVAILTHVSPGKLSLTPKVSEIVLQGFLNAGTESKESEPAKVRPPPRELEIIRLLAEGKANKEIASTLGITVRTVETHRAKIMMKLGLHSLTGVIHYAIRHKIIAAPGIAY